MPMVISPSSIKCAMFGSDQAGVALFALVFFLSRPWWN